MYFAKIIAKLEMIAMNRATSMEWDNYKNSTQNLFIVILISNDK